MKNKFHDSSCSSSTVLFFVSDNMLRGYYLFWCAGIFGVLAFQFCEKRSHPSSFDMETMKHFSSVVDLTKNFKFRVLGGDYDGTMCDHDVTMM